MGAKQQSAVFAGTADAANVPWQRKRLLSVAATRTAGPSHFDTSVALWLRAAGMTLLLFAGAGTLAIQPALADCAL